MTPKQNEHVMALVKERHAVVKNALEDLLNAFSRGEKARIVSANETFRTTLHQLNAVIAQDLKPTWLKEITAHADHYVTNHNAGVAIWRSHLNSIMTNSEKLKNESWSFKDEEKFFDVDQIILKAIEQNRFIELYDRIIECLDAIINSGEVDSVKAFHDLKRVISNLQDARSGSFSSQVFNWQFARRFIPNIISSYLKTNPVTGPLIEAFEQTASELDISLEKTKDQIGTEILTAAALALRTDASKQITGSSIIFLEKSSNDSKISA